MHLVGEGLLPECSIGDPEQCMATYILLVCASMGYQWQAVHRQYKFPVTTVVEVASGKGHSKTALINARNSAYDFSVKLRPCMCSHSSCPGCWYMCYEAVSCEDLPNASSSLSYYARAVVDSDKSCSVPWKISKSAVCCSLRLAPWWWIISLVVKNVTMLWIV